MTQLTIKHSVVAITLDQDLTARKGDILVVSPDGTGQPAVLPGMSFQITDIEKQKSKSIIKSTPAPIKVTTNTAHVIKDRLLKENPRLNERECRYLDTLSKYEDPCTTRDLATLVEEDYEKASGAAQTNILRPMITARMVERERLNGTTQRNGIYGYSITRKGKRVLRNNKQLNLKEVA